jgi:hypothetical protein
VNVRYLDLVDYVAIAAEVTPAHLPGVAAAVRVGSILSPQAEQP